MYVAIISAHRLRSNGYMQAWLQLFIKSYIVLYMLLYVVMCGYIYIYTHMDIFCYISFQRARARQRRSGERKRGMKGLGFRV